MVKSRLPLGRNPEAQRTGEARGGEGRRGGEGNAAITKSEKKTVNWILSV